MHAMKEVLRWMCLATAGLLVLLAGCSVRVHRSSDAGDGDKDKDVSIHMPFGNLQVHKQGSGAVDTGLPVYPGATVETNDRHESVGLEMGFGKWQLRVQAANYVSADPEAKVRDYYSKALGRYGEVLTCRGHDALGARKRTSEGLTCDDDEGGRPEHVSSSSHVELKAGSRRKQHIVAFDGDRQPATHFTLLALTLPIDNSTGTGSAADE